jgi:hypothetical protein
VATIPFQHSARTAHRAVQVDTSSNKEMQRYVTPLHACGTGVNEETGEHVYTVPKTST